ncbi:carbohydrate-binding module family 24 protein [Parathielavia hyrcaniae]|uniref:Carbohydrate-binding module family 24 protein n=1 Tax=Parathielavia hyrcaniae TaxID=113614 RepID=A0AAN6PRM9_9PEZI|nr:carbohydrate-binding module family 24 protein [Parathielavia hyrcaniae]
MKLPVTALTSLLACGAGLAEAKAVFAHFMVTNTKSFGLDDWKNEIQLAKRASIDAFALDMASDDPANDVALPLAFDAAVALEFELFFSFDYAGNGPWAKSVVTDMISTYGSSIAYHKRAGKPFVSTFEGPANAIDWQDIKRDTDCFFMPDWSSIGAQRAVQLANGVADGLFSWDAWPKGPADMTTYPDASYYDFLGSKPYMMPVSPWFYTNLPGYDKNWLWRGDDLWFQRWQQVISFDRQPDYIQIISWNDFGESHYIGPLDDRQYDAFDIGRAPFNYAKDMPHDGWRETLPYYISMYKLGSATITRELVVTWYRVNKNGACSDGGTTGNTASQLQFEYSPSVMMQDRVFYDVLLTSNAHVEVSIGGVVQEGSWDQGPYQGVGVYHGSVPIGGAHSGPVVVTVKRAGTTIATVNGASITRNCAEGINNYNPWVGSAAGPSVSAVHTHSDVQSLDCVEGFGVYEFTGVCDFACANGYCPSAACTCLRKGEANPPNPTGVTGYPRLGKSGSFVGLCSFDCNHGYCPDSVCGTIPNDGVLLGYSPFLPPACTGGTARAGLGAFQGLCDFGCHLGFCPIHACTCLSTGILVQTPPKTDKSGYSFLDESVDDHGLCKFACEHGYCPDVCGKRPVGGGNECLVGDRMYSDEDVPQEGVGVWSWDGQKLDHAEDTDGTQYVTIVNLTPYRMVHTPGPEPYQFSVWEFGDVPSGKARENEVMYDTGLHVRSFVDTNGYANYKLEGTDKTFKVHVTTHIPDRYERRVVFDLGGMGMGWRELGFPGERVSVALIITGSEEYGYVNSLQLNNIAWMRSMYDVIKDRHLRHVVVPGAHDAAASKISDGGWFGGGTSLNTATQSLDHYNQLRVGVRYFDMRIVSINGGDFWGAHVNDETSAAPLGATGESLDDLILGINRFTTDYPGEVIVWSIRYMTDLDNKKHSSDDRYWSANKAAEFYTQLERINNRCPPDLGSNPTFDKRPLKDFMDANDGKGCVLIFTKGELRDGIAKDRTSSSIYRLGDHLDLDDYWAEDNRPGRVAQKQTARLLDHTRDGMPDAGDPDDDNYFIMQWQVTLGLGDMALPPFSIQLVANQATNPGLYNYGVNEMTPEYFPTVIMHDAVGLFHISDLSFENYNPMMQTLVIGLYMVSQNCNVSKIKHPFLEGAEAAAGSGFLSRARSPARVSSGFQTFRGVIFANGTVLDEAPPGFCRTCTYNDTVAVDHPEVNGTDGARRRWRRGVMSSPVTVW